MTEIARAIEHIAVVAEEVGLPALAREADVPYTTAVGWRSAGWRPNAVVTLERLDAAARRLRPEPDGDAADQDHAA